MKRTLITIVLTSVVVLTLVGVASSQLFMGQAAPTEAYNYGVGGGGGGNDFYSGAPVAMEMPAAAPEESKVLFDGTTSNQVVAVDRIVIKNADMAIVVKDPQASMTAITKLAEEMGGYVVAANLYRTSYGVNNLEVPEATITIRVPAEKLNEVLSALKQDAVDVQYENISSQDVTSEYVDLQSRLEAKQAAEKKLLEILEGAEKTEDVLAVYSQLQLIQTEIEALKGQIKYYDQSAALSSVSIRLVAEEGTQPITIGPWKPAGAAKQAVEDLVRFFQNFVEFLIRFVIYVLPSLVMIAIPLSLVYLAGRGLYRRFRKATPAATETEEKK